MSNIVNSAFQRSNELVADRCLVIAQANHPQFDIGTGSAQGAVRDLGLLSD